MQIFSFLTLAVARSNFWTASGLMMTMSSVSSSPSPVLSLA